MATSGTTRAFRGTSALILVLVATAGAARADEGVLVFGTEDWTFESPAVLGTQADLELSARQIQLCTDEIERLVSHRPRNVERFGWRWVIDGLQVSYGGPTGVETHVPSPAWRLVDASTRSFRESIVARGACFGPHEISHVLTWESWHMAWANEGFATFTDWLYEGASWRCCGEAVRLLHECDEPGYTDGPTHHPYTDLRRFAVSIEMYFTAACFFGVKSSVRAASRRSAGFSCGCARTSSPHQASSSSTMSSLCSRPTSDRSRSATGSATPTSSPRERSHLTPRPPPSSCPSRRHPSRVPAPGIGSRPS